MARPVTGRPVSHVKRVTFASGRTVMIQTAMRADELKTRMPAILEAYHECRRRLNREDASGQIDAALVRDITHGTSDDTPNMRIVRLDGQDWIAFSKTDWIATIDGKTVFRRVKKDRRPGRPRTGDKKEG